MTTHPRPFGSQLPRRRLRQRWDRGDEQGSAAVEAVILVPAFALFIGLLVFAGRTAVAHQGMQAVAADAARSASMARTPASAQAGAEEAITYSLANNNLRCATSSVELDVSGFSAPIGTPGMVTATVTCTLNLGDLAVPGVPGTHTVSASMVSVVDTWRSAP
ncbi:TadE/TadG family type IV pilus assembly protein [Pengzhenrongella sicca]|uniref:Pilus assembly protein n=1 Tax=Pengzhenrongella sicca TaxID=2819238 RepID=A0A8A4Z9L6_9MICO|nr:TadE/TadG family type IV pilus assembly protein [Pengzhenrongella sicca]QTE28582.1 pilus assembly protein [Pengzhenrongella sicca]